MYKLSGADLVKEIAKLPTDRSYQYVSEKRRNRSANERKQIRIANITYPEGPIRFIRKDNQGRDREATITTGMITKMALACATKPNYPLHIDRLFSAGGNTRSAFEALLAYTPHFFICYPSRIDSYTGEILHNLKHFMWCPDDEHTLGEIAVKEYTEDISELELGIDFGHIDITQSMLGDEFESIEAKRTHTQMQIALVEIGNALNFHTWIAKNDRHIPVRDTKLGEMKGVIQSLEDVRMLYDEQIRIAASLIDCIWFTQDHRQIPAVIEVEHSTGVRSGLLRMQNFREAFPDFQTTFTVVAPNKLRDKVVSEANQRVFRNLKARFMPYSTVRDLYGLIQRYQLANVVDHTFVKPFMEQIVDD